MHIINPYRFAAAGPLVQDTFTDANATALASHNPDIDTVGGGWSALAGTWTIQSNKATATSGAAHAVIGCGTANCVITVDITFGTLSSALTAGVIARVTDTNNHWLLGITFGNDTNPTLQIIERVAGTPTTRATLTLTGEGPLTGETWPFTVTLSGNDLTIATVINGTPYSRTYNSALYNTNTIHGFRSRTAEAFDNLEINAL